MLTTDHKFHLHAAANKTERDTAIAEAAAAGATRAEIAEHAQVSLSVVARAIKWYAENLPAPDMSEVFAQMEEEAAEEEQANEPLRGSLEAVTAAADGPKPIRDEAIVAAINCGYNSNAVAAAAGISTIRLGQIVRGSATPRLTDYQTGYQSALADILALMGDPERVAAWINDNRMEAAEGIFARRAAEEV